MINSNNMKQIKAKYLLIPAVICLLVMGVAVYYYFFTAFSKHQEVMYVYLDDDDTLDSVLTKLEPIGNRHGMTALSTLVNHTSYADNIRTGRYAIDPDVSSVALYRQLKSGRQKALMLTIPESRTMDRLAAQLSHRLMLDSADIADALLDPAFTAKYGYDTATVACMFVPNTYEVYWDVTLDRLMSRMQKEHDAFWEGERSEKAKALGL